MGFGAFGVLVCSFSVSGVYVKVPQTLKRTLNPGAAKTQSLNRDLGMELADSSKG